MVDGQKFGIRIFTEWSICFWKEMPDGILKYWRFFDFLGLKTVRNKWKWKEICNLSFIIDYKTQYFNYWERTPGVRSLRGWGSTTSPNTYFCPNHGNRSKHNEYRQKDSKDQKRIKYEEERVREEWKIKRGKVNRHRQRVNSSYRVQRRQSHQHKEPA